MKTRSLLYLAGITGFTVFVDVHLGLAQSGDAPRVELGADTVIGASNERIEVNGEGKTFTIAGNKDQVRIYGNCTAVNVAGNENRIELDKVGAIKLLGNGNEVSYGAGAEGVEPVIVQVGSNNHVRQNAKRAESGEATLPNPATSGATAGPIKSQVVRVSNGNVNQEITAQDVILEGNNGNVILQGTAESLTVEGSNNNVRIGTVSKIIFHGARNNVMYEGSGRGLAPEHEGIEESNNVVQTTN